jgi:hypothetical protein
MALLLETGDEGGIGIAFPDEETECGGGVVARGEEEQAACGCRG